MGLDMYLTAERYLWNHGLPNDIKLKTAIAAIFALDGDIPGSVESITTEAAYWRKANAIHKWFVDNVQDGVDECQRASVERDQLQELVDLCQSVLDNPDTASTELPCAGGFFFGSVEYDEYYIGDLKSTVEQLTPLLDDKFAQWEFYYRSSW